MTTMQFEQQIVCEQVRPNYCYEPFNIAVIQHSNCSDLWKSCKRLGKRSV